MVWKIENINQNIKISNPIFIGGLPGIGNVGKITIDFMISELKADKVAEFTSDYLPYSVFVNEDNLIEIPKIVLYHKKIKNQEFLFLTGDAQPIDEPSTYQLCYKILEFIEKHHCKEMICLGGIGLQSEPKNPKVYCTANNKKIIARYKKEIKLNNNISGLVGPIIGLSGLLPGLAGRRNIDAMILLAETFAHPLYVGIKGAKEIVKLLNQKFNFKIDIKKLEKDIKDIEQSVKKRSEDINAVSKTLKDIRTKEIKYIG
ncbi:PAC2 family protein [Candidatus Woesearchaeota archaeon]|nr:PAC2 family protein [Candidatus Woesearchaeota archaeon]